MIARADDDVFLSPRMILAHVNLLLSKERGGARGPLIYAGAFEWFAWRTRTLHSTAFGGRRATRAPAAARRGASAPRPPRPRGTPDWITATRKFPDERRATTRWTSAAPTAASPGRTCASDRWRLQRARESSSPPPPCARL
jgi:hypothetical protein